MCGANVPDIFIRNFFLKGKGMKRGVEIKDTAGENSLYNKNRVAVECSEKLLRRRECRVYPPGPLR
jgi:hypothetical protein